MNTSHTFTIVAFDEEEKKYILNIQRERERERERKRKRPTGSVCEYWRQGAKHLKDDHHDDDDGVEAHNPLNFSAT